MRKILGMLILLTASAFAQLTPSAIAGYVYNGSQWTPLTGGAVGQALGYSPNPVALYTWNGSAWQPWSGSSATGTVTSFSAGNLAPIFTTSVATATSTPALTFSLTNAAAGTLFGNSTGSPAAPSYGSYASYGLVSSATFPTGAPSAGQIPVGNAGGTAYAAVSLSQDCTNTSAGVVTCLKTNNTAFTTAATTAIGTSGATIPLLNGANTFSGTQIATTWSGTVIKGAGYQTAANCAVNSVSPAACGSAAAGAVVVPTTTVTYTVSTSAATTTSRIFLFPMSFASNLPSAPTCVVPAITAEPTISAISNGVSFTFTLASTTGQTCWSYFIVN